MAAAATLNLFPVSIGHMTFSSCSFLYSYQISQFYLNRRLSYCVLWKNSIWRPPPSQIC